MKENFINYCIADRFVRILVSFVLLLNALFILTTASRNVHLMAFRRRLCKSLTACSASSFILVQRHHLNKVNICIHLLFSLHHIFVIDSINFTVYKTVSVSGQILNNPTNNSQPIQCHILEECWKHLNLVYYWYHWKAIHVDKSYVRTNWEFWGH